MKKLFCLTRPEHQGAGSIDAKAFPCFNARTCGVQNRMNRFTPAFAESS